MYKRQGKAQTKGLRPQVKLFDGNGEEVRMHGSDPVSYTHLDVYKRQLSYLQAGTRWLVLRQDFWADQGLRVSVREI